MFQKMSELQNVTVREFIINYSKSVPGDTSFIPIIGLSDPSLLDAPFPFVLPSYPNKNRKYVIPTNLMDPTTWDVLSDPVVTHPPLGWGWN